MRYHEPMFAIEKFSFSECMLLKEGSLVAYKFFLDLYALASVSSIQKAFSLFFYTFPL